MNNAFQQTDQQTTNKILQQNATNVQQIATRGGGERAPIGVVQRLDNLFFTNKLFSACGQTGNGTFQFHFIALKLLFPDRPSASC